ncbi:alpha/beta hydrolase [Microtetraspora malaysiensis]|uniref:alpha/beta hydrolase n=1 Tax=Microtetraspora malaysiensis TaxID=161358 RepID=UPI000A960E9B|nr:alpha/beta hydrolase [Microtetraspora malaysiensis]
MLILQSPRSSLVLSVVAALGLLPATAAVAGTTAGTAAVAPAISWEACTGLPVPTAGLDCGKLTVPLDYGNSRARTVDVAVIRAKATGTRTGSLVMNFGGGGNGVIKLAAGHQNYAALREHYDLVSFDPRGSGGTSPLTCASGAVADRLFTVNPGVRNPADRKAFLRATADFIRTCEKEGGGILPHAGMGDTARDMDRLRAALGENKLNYYGMSLGSVLGGVYATLHPQRVGRMVLDAGLNPRQSVVEVVKQLTRTSQLGYERFLAWCVKKGCDLGKDAKEVNGAIEGLVERLKSKPLKGGDRPVGASLAIAALQAVVGGEPYWQELEARLAQAIKGDGDPLLKLADAITGRQDGTYPLFGVFGSAPYSSAVYCRDRDRPAVRDLPRVEAELTRISPIFGQLSPMTAFLIPTCAQWPVPVDPEGRTVGHTGPAPILVISSEKDTAAPAKEAASLSRQLTNGVLVTYGGDLHGAYPAGGPCVSGIVEDYVVTGKVPAKGTSCPAT